MEKKRNEDGSRKPDIEVTISFEVDAPKKKQTGKLALFGSWVFIISVCAFLFCAYHYFIEAALVFFLIAFVCAIVWAAKIGPRMRWTSRL